MDNLNKINIFGISINGILTAIQSNPLFELISFIATLILTIILICYNGYKWYILAKKDGKITKEEIEEGIKIVIDGAEQVKSAIDDKKKGN